MPDFSALRDDEVSGIRVDGAQEALGGRVVALPYRWFRPRFHGDQESGGCFFNLDVIDDILMAEAVQI